MILGLAIAVPGNPKADDARAEALFSLFQAEVMRPPQDGEEARIVKWTRPVNIIVQGRLSKELFQSIPASLVELSERINHPISMDPARSVNVAFLFSPNVFLDAKDRLRPEALKMFGGNEKVLDRFIARGEANKGMGCYAQNLYDRNDNTMHYAVAFVSTERPKEAFLTVDQTWCFWTYLLESLGFVGKTRIEVIEGMPQVVTIKRHATKANLFLQFLYRPDVLPGMTASQVRPLFIEHLKAVDPEKIPPVVTTE